MNLLAVVFWIYFVGSIGTTLIFVFQCTSFTDAHWDQMVKVLYSKEEIVGILVFFCLNDGLNTVLLLYLLKKSYISKSSVYGIINAIFIIVEGIMK